MNMNQNDNIFDRRLRGLLVASGVERGELARYLGVSVPTLNRWLNGISTPNAYQFRAIAHYFGMPYDWFLEDNGGIPDVDDLAVKLGLSPETVEALLELAASEDEGVLTAVDDAVCAVIATINAVYDDLLAIAENSGG
jgi:transcriptional regulator with XRE-family HTH domain